MLLRRSIYRSRALLRQRQVERLDETLRVTAPHEWAILCTLGAVLLGGAAWALFGRIEQYVSVPGALVVSGERHDVVSAIAGTVLRVSVAVGDQVTVGDTIADVAMAGAVPTSDLVEPLDELLTRNLRQAVIEVIEASLGYRAGLPGLHRLVSPVSGEVTLLGLRPGLVVQVGEHVAQIASTSDPRFEVVAYVPWDESAEIAVGTEARVLVDSPYSNAQETLHARVRAVSHRPEQPAAWLEGLELLPIPAGPTRRVRVALSEPLGDWAVDRTACRLLVPTGYASSVSMLVPGRRR